MSGNSKQEDLLARAKREKRVVLVGGEVDRMLLHMAGIPAVVANLADCSCLDIAGDDENCPVHGRGTVRKEC